MRKCASFWSCLLTGRVARAPLFYRRRRPVIVRRSHSTPRTSSLNASPSAPLQREFDTHLPITDTSIRRHFFHYYTMFFVSSSLKVRTLLLQSSMPARQLVAAVANTDLFYTSSLSNLRRIFTYCKAITRVKKSPVSTISGADLERGLRVYS